jgi:DNA polymerase III subunit beta
MLKTTILSSNLKNSLSFVHHAISSRNPLPILSNFLIEAKEGNVYISGTDLEIGMKVKIPAKVDEEGETTVSAKTFLDLISNINQEKVTLEQKDNTLFLTGEKLKTSFPTFNASDFPKLYESKGEKVAEFKREDFDKEIQRVVFASAGDIGRPALSGVLIRNSSKGLVMVATDGYRLSIKQGLSEDSVKGEGDVNLLIPSRVIKEVLGIKEADKIELFISKESNQALFEGGDTIVVGRLIDAEYPDYQKIIPDEFSTRIVFDKSEAQSAVRACSVFAREAANIVKMSVEKDKLVFSASASSVGENEIEVSGKSDGEENEIAFNARYLLELLSVLDEDSIVFEMNGPLNPGVFKLEKDKSYLHLIMPIRITD